MVKKAGSKSDSKFRAVVTDTTCQQLFQVEEMVVCGLMERQPVRMEEVPDYARGMWLHLVKN